MDTRIVCSLLTENISNLGSPWCLSGKKKKKKIHLPIQETQIQSLGQEDPLEKEMATQYSCWENPMDRGAWQAPVHRVAQTRT